MTTESQFKDVLNSIEGDMTVIKAIYKLSKKENMDSADHMINYQKICEDLRTMNKECESFIFYLIELTDSKYLREKENITMEEVNKGIDLFYSFNQFLINEGIVE